MVLFEVGNVHPLSLKFSSVKQKLKQLEGLPQHRFKLSEK